MTKYGQDYFEWQRRIGEFGGQANAFKFIDHCNENLVTLDFGCGGGYLLANLPAKRRIGVEVNEFAREMATANGIEVFDSAAPLEDGSIDLIVSNHALEHCRYPLGELKALYQKLADGGTAVFAVPCETVKNVYKEDDVNQHLYSWSPQALGNLFQEAGVLRAEIRAVAAQVAAEIPQDRQGARLARIPPDLPGICENFDRRVSGHLRGSETILGLLGSAGC